MFLSLTSRFVVSIVVVVPDTVRSPLIDTLPAKLALAPVNVSASVLELGLNLIAPVPVFDMSAKPFVEKFKSSPKVISPTVSISPVLECIVILSPPPLLPINL